jgi:hypothetical protein
LRQLQTFYGRPKDDLHSVTLVFYAGTKLFEEALNAIKFFEWLETFGPAKKILGPVNAVKSLGWIKKFGPTQNILGPVKGQGIRVLCSYVAFLFLYL